MVHFVQIRTLELWLSMPLEIDAPYTLPYTYTGSFLELLLSHYQDLEHYLKE